MADFAVWAPLKQRVQLVAGPPGAALTAPETTPHEMIAHGDGWWRITLPDGEATRSYAFLLDDDPTPLPDPRSAHQPDGVHAPSRRYDQAAHRWGDQAWTGRQLPGSVVYELHIGTFTTGPDTGDGYRGGTFDTAIERLDHLVELGVDLVEVMPVNAVDSPVNWGYDGVAWYAVTENYGGPDAFKRFVDACHRRGLGVILDVVYNHLGPSGAYLDRFGPYFAGSNTWGRSLNLDGPHSDEVRRYVIDNALRWLRDFHVDGLRLDAVHALVDDGATHLLEQLAVAVESLSAHLGRPLSLIAESDLNDARMVTAREAGGYGLHAQWDDDVHHALHAALTGETQGYYADFGSPEVLRTVLTEVFLHAGTWSSFRQRHHGRPVDLDRVPGHRFLAYLQNHDQVGNRAAGDRLSASLPPAALACGAALLLCSPFTPMLFMGEEWGARTPFQFFSHFPDEGLRTGVRDGRIAEFGRHGWSAEVPDPNAISTFRDSALDWSEPDRPPHAGLLAVYRELIALRRREPELSDPWLGRVRVSVRGRVVVMVRGGLRVVANLGGDPSAAELDGCVAEVLTAAGVSPGVPDGATLRLDGWGYAVLRLA